MSSHHSLSNGTPALARVTKEIAMSEPDEPIAYTAAPPTQRHPQDEEEE